MEPLALLTNKTSAHGNYEHISPDEQPVLTNFSLANVTTIRTDRESGPWLTLNELQMIKVVVLVIVVGILLLSTCKIVFKTFSRYSEKRADPI